MRQFLVFILLLLNYPRAFAAPPRLLLEVARFRALDQRQPGAELDLAVTVPTQSLLYRQRARRLFQASARVELRLVRAEGGQPVWQESIALRPPVQSDTGAAIKNPVIFLRRVAVPDGRYVLRGQVQDENRPGTPPTVVEQPLTVAAPGGPAFSDVLLLAAPAARAAAPGETTRGGYQLSRAPGGLYSRGNDVAYFYAELSNLPAGRPVRLRYRLGGPAGAPVPAPADAPAPLTPLAGRPTPVVGQVALGALPAGPFTLTLEARDAATGKLLVTQQQAGQRAPDDYIQAGAAPAPRP